MGLNHPKRRLAFSITELLVVISVITIMSGVVMVNYATSRAVARDTLRRKSVAAYQLTAEQWFNAKKTYVVYEGNTCTYQIDCAGYRKQGWGSITRKNITTANGPIYGSKSIAEIWRDQGYLTEIRTDPRAQNFSDYSTDPTSFKDFVLTICDAQGNQASTLRGAIHYAIYAQLERPTSTEPIQALKTCGGPDTPSGGWNVVL